MVEEEEMEKQVNDGTFDECAYVKDDDDLCIYQKWPTWHVTPNKSSPLPPHATSLPPPPLHPQTTLSNNLNFKS